MTRATLALIDTSAGIRLIGAAVVAVLLIGPATALAQQPATRTEEVSAAFTIEAIDHSSRIVTLRNKAGLLEEVYCGPEVQRFDAAQGRRRGHLPLLRDGRDRAEPARRRGGGAPSTTVTRTPGAPGGSIARQTTATVTLDAIDPKTPSVTVRTASGGRSTFRVQDAKNLEGYKVGDQVSITYTRGLAVSVTPPAQPAAAEPKARMEIYGFAMLDMGVNFKSINPNWFDTMRVNRLPSFDGEFGEDGSTFAGVRQTRLGVRGFNPTPLGELRTTFEFEMFGTGVDEGPDDVPPAARLRRTGRLRRRPVLEPVHGHRRVPELARVLGTHRHGVLPQRPGALDADPGHQPADHRRRAAGRVGRRRPAGRPYRAGGRQRPVARCPTSPPSTAGAARAATSRRPACSAGWNGTT